MLVAAGGLLAVDGGHHLVVGVEAFAAVEQCAAEDCDCFEVEGFRHFW